MTSRPISEYGYSLCHLQKGKNADFYNSDWPVFPIAVDLGSVSSSAEPIVWVVGFVRDPSISYTIGGQAESLRPYYTTEFDTVESAVRVAACVVSLFLTTWLQLKFFIADFNASLSRAVALDAQVREEAAKVSPDGKLFNMLSLVTRQVFSSLEITASQSQGDEVRIFMKDMGMSKLVHILIRFCSTVSQFVSITVG